MENQQIFLLSARRIAFYLLIGGFVFVSCQYFQKQEQILSETVTNDQFRVAFSNAGELKGVYIGDETLPFTTFMRAHSGWLIRDKKTGVTDYFRGQLAPIAQNILVQKGIIERLGLEMESRYEGGNDFIKITGTIKSLSRNERALDLSFQFPVDYKGMIWEGNCDTHHEIGLLKHYQNSFVKFALPDSALYFNGYRGTFPLYPYAGLSDSGKKYGISCAIPPDFISNFSFNYYNQIFSTTFNVGISPNFRTPNQVTVTCIYFLHDPQWGFRSITARYQSLFRYYFSPDSQYAGLMKVSGKASISDEKDFSLHVLGGDAYKAHSFEEYVQLSGVDSATNENVFPYISVGHREMSNVAKKPNSEKEALQLFEKWSARDTFFYQSPESDNSYKTVSQLKGLIKNSNIYTPSQEPLMLTKQVQRTYELIFPLNPGYHVWDDTNLVTPAKYLFTVYIPEVVARFRQASGVFIGDLSNWSRLYNFRREHFKYAQYPLSYHPESLYVCIPTTSSLRELLDSLRYNQNKNHKKLCCGGVLPGDLPIAHIGDYIESDISADSLKNLDYLRWFRIACGPKPVFIRWPSSIQNLQQADEQWNRCLAYGYFPSFSDVFTVNTSLDSAIIYKRQEYTPLLNALNRTQWKPITYAWVSNNSLVIERFGTDRYSGIYFTVFNPQSKSMNGIVSISLKPLKLPASTNLVNELAPNQRHSLFLDREGKINTSVTLKPHEVIVFRAEY